MLEGTVEVTAGSSPFTAHRLVAQLPPPAFLSHTGGTWLPEATAPHSEQRPCFLMAEVVPDTRDGLFPLQKQQVLPKH